METSNKQLSIENALYTSTIEVLKEVTPTPTTKIKQSELPQSLSASLRDLFPEQQYEEKTVQKAKQILGEIAGQLSPEELTCTVAEVQYLAETWLNDFERQIFNGLTLKELLHEKGGL